MDKQVILFRVSIALNELYKYGRASVFKEEILQPVESALSSMGLNYIIKPEDDTHCEIELI